MHFDQIYDDEQWKISNFFGKNQIPMACIQWDQLPAKLLISSIAFLRMLKKILLLKPFTNFSLYFPNKFFRFFAKNEKDKKLPSFDFFFIYAMRLFLGYIAT